MSVVRSPMLQCTILPVGKVLSLAVSTFSVAAIRSALSQSTGCAADSFALFAKNNGRLEEWTAENGSPKALYVLLRCRGGGKGGFRKQLEKKGREFARAKMKEKRNSAKTPAKKETVKEAGKQERESKASISKAETSVSRTLVKQGLAFVLKSCQAKTTEA